METKDLRFRKLYQKILICLLSEDFSVDYFSRNKDIRNIVMDFLQITSSDKQKNNRNKLLTALKNVNLDSVSDMEVLNNAQYKNSKIIEHIFSEHNSYFSDMSLENKKALFILDLCCNSVLKNIFYSDKIVFYLKDFYSLMNYVLDTTNKQLRSLLLCAVKFGLVDFKESEQLLSITNLFEHELLRLSTIPHFESFNLNDYEINGEPDAMPSPFNTAVSFTGECVSSYVYSRLKSEGTYFWYAKGADDFLKLSHYLMENDFFEECIWLDKYVFETDDKEMSVLNNSSGICSNFIICGNKLKNNILIPCLKISLKDSCLENKVDRMFSSDLAHSIKSYMSKIATPSKKRDLIAEVNQLVVNTDSESIMNLLPDLFSDFTSRLKKEEAEKKSIITAIDENDFIKRYGNNASRCSDTPGLKEKVQHIYQALMTPAEYLKTDKKMFIKFNALMQQHPNIIDTKLLYGIMKIALLFSKENIIRTPPLLLIGPPGCGKTMLCKELRELFNQDHDIFIPMGNGSGITELLGSTQEYRGASHGQVLASIWEALDNRNCLNAIIVIDEIEKACLSSQVSDMNQDVLPSLLQLFGEENIIHYKDNFFDVEIKNFIPNFIATANSKEPIPEALLNRMNIIRFRDYTKEELKALVIPYQYELFRKKHNALIPEILNEDEIEIIFNLCKGQTRQIQPSFIKYIAAIFDSEGKKHQLSNMEVEDLLNDSMVNDDNKQIGFCTNTFFEHR